MAVSLPNGAKLALAVAYGAVINVTAATNAAPAVLSAALHDLEDGDYVEVTSGWGKLSNRVFRVAAAETGTFELEGTDTTDLKNFPAGRARITVRKIDSLEQVTQVLSSTSSGGEMAFAEVSLLEETDSFQLPTQASAQSIALSLADDPTLPGYKAVKAAADARAIRALICTLPTGSEIIYNAYVSLNETPTLTKNEVMAVTATFSLRAPPVRYSA
jgi:hypothetical protein